MKKIILKGLSPEIERLIDERAKAEHMSPAQAVMAILEDAEIERAIQHDIALLDSWLVDDAASLAQVGQA